MIRNEHIAAGERVKLTEIGQQQQKARKKRVDGVYWFPRTHFLEGLCYCLRAGTCVSIREKVHSNRVATEALKTVQ